MVSHGNEVTSFVTRLNWNKQPTRPEFVEASAVTIIVEAEAMFHSTFGPVLGRNFFLPQMENKGRDGPQLAFVEGTRPTAHSGAAHPFGNH